MFIYARSEQCDLGPFTLLYSCFLLLRIYPDSPVHTSAKYGAYSDLSSYAVNLPG